MNNSNFAQTQNLLSFYNQYRGIYPKSKHSTRSGTQRKTEVLPDSTQTGILSGKEMMTAIVTTVLEKERKLIGRELHDNVNQILTSVRLLLEMLNLPGQREIGIRKKTLEYITLAIDEIRQISGELVAKKQGGKKLVENIQQIIDDLRFSTSMKLEFETIGDIASISSDKELTIFRIVQEQIKNIVKYSHAKQVSIQLHVKKAEIFLMIHDDGIGFDSAKTSKGIGFANIQERAASHRGKVDIYSAKGEGCKLVVKIPR